VKLPSLGNVRATFRLRRAARRPTGRRGASSDGPARRVVRRAGAARRPTGRRGARVSAMCAEERRGAGAGQESLSVRPRTTRRFGQAGSGGDIRLPIYLCDGLAIRALKASGRNKFTSRTGTLARRTRTGRARVPVLRVASQMPLAQQDEEAAGMAEPGHGSGQTRPIRGMDVGQVLTSVIQPDEELRRPPVWRGSPCDERGCGSGRHQGRRSVSRRAARTGLRRLPSFQAVSGR